MTALVFLDTETTGLSLDDDVWEFAAIRRETDGSQTEHHLFIRHDTQKCARLPEPFLSDHQRRFPASHTDQWHELALQQATAAHRIAELFAEDKPHVVGAVPNFDTERLARLLETWGDKPGWHYHLIDVEALAVGWLHCKAAKPIVLPWDSDELSRACGVEPPGEGERHTAMGDAQWAMRLYDAIMGGVS